MVTLNAGGSEVVAMLGAILPLFAMLDEGDNRCGVRAAQPGLWQEHVSSLICRAGCMIARNKAEIMQAGVVHMMINRPHDEAGHR
jgi:hypothetical protein